MNSGEERRPVYVVVKRRAIATQITVWLVLFIGILASFQYSNYVDRRSNQDWCEIVTIFNDTYKEVPPPTDTGKKFQRAFHTLGDKYKC